ncbi:MAG: hypothetical protein ABI640_19220 [Gammaproteobacteria bacterium]
MWSSSRYTYTRALIAAAAAVASVSVAVAAEDLAALRVDPQRSQSADQLRRDRYECHNWAVEQTGQAPVATEDEREQPSDAKRNKRAERASRAILGAALGSMVGGIAGSGRGWRHANDAVLTGAAVGAGVGAATAGGKVRDKGKTEAAQPPSEYVRALSACLEGRGYTVTLPSPPNATARR